MRAITPKNSCGDALTGRDREGRHAVGAETDTAATVEAAETGTGIAAEYLPHVFDRFYRADPSRSSPGGNLGLGLAIVKAVVELHGGTVELDSVPGRGTRVTLAFQRG